MLSNVHTARSQPLQERAAVHTRCDRCNARYNVGCSTYRNGNGLLIGSRNDRGVAVSLRLVRCRKLGQFHDRMPELWQIGLSSPVHDQRTLARAQMQQMRHRSDGGLAGTSSAAASVGGDSARPLLDRPFHR